jgi:hypothetical protein
MDATFFIVILCSQGKENPGKSYKCFKKVTKLNVDEIGYFSFN